MGYISYIDSETGEGINNSSNSSQPKKIDLPDNFNEAMMEIAAKIDGMSGNYGYIWDNENEEWITIENNGIRSMAENLEMELAHLKDKFAMLPDQPDQTMEAYHIGNDNEMVSKELEEAFVRQMKYKAGIIK